VNARSASSVTCCTPVFIGIQELFNRLLEVCSFNISQKASRNVLKGFPRCFLAVTENTLKVIVFEKLTYLWTNENACLSLLCTKSWEFLRQVYECRTVHIQTVTKCFISPILCVVEQATISLVLAEVQVLHS
jgi:hypothetical protein